MSRRPRPHFTREVAVALIAGVAAVATSYAVVGRSASFVAAPVAEFASRTMPGPVLAFAITVLGDLGQELNFAMAIGLVTAAFALAAYVAQLARRELGVGQSLLGATLAGALAFVLGGVLQALLIAGAVLLVLALDDLAAALYRHDPLSTKRRRALSTIGATAGLATVGYSAGGFEPPSATAAEAPSLEGENVDRTTIEERLSEADAAAVDEDALAPLVSEAFYNVDINNIDPEIDAGDWELTITGAVEEERTYSYDEIRSYAAEHRFAALRCVGEPLNGQKMDAALWTGVAVQELLAEANPQGGCDCVMLRGDDGYYQEFPLPALEEGLLAYGMNGNVLPKSHGYPLRALVPGHWGEVNLKWLTEIEVLEEEATGFWEKRGWHGTGPVVPVAKLHTEADHPEGRLLGGHAYAGTRGVSTVEVSTDDGDTWNEARLSDPLPDGDMWRQWAYAYDPPEETHTVVVRMVDDNGEVQPKEERDAYPHGASGWVSSTY